MNILLIIIKEAAKIPATNNAITNLALIKFAGIGSILSVYLLKKLVKSHSTNGLSMLLLLLAYLLALLLIGLLVGLIAASFLIGLFTFLGLMAVTAIYILLYSNTHC